VGLGASALPSTERPETILRGSSRSSVREMCPVGRAAACLPAHGLMDTSPVGKIKSWGQEWGCVAVGSVLAASSKLRR